MVRNNISDKNLPVGCTTMEHLSLTDDGCEGNQKGAMNDDSNPQQGATSTEKPTSARGKPDHAPSSSSSQRKPVHVKIPPTKKDNRKLFIGGLPANLTGNEFREFFEHYGTVIDSVVMFDRETRRSRGFGFVTFEDVAVAQSLLNSGSDRTDRTAIDCPRIGKVSIRGKVCEVKAACPKPSNVRSGRRSNPRVDESSMRGENKLKSSASVGNVEDEKVGVDQSSLDNKCANGSEAVPISDKLGAIPNVYENPPQQTPVAADCVNFHGASGQPVIYGPACGDNLPPPGVMTPGMYYPGAMYVTATTMYNPYMGYPPEVLPVSMAPGVVPSSSVAYQNGVPIPLAAPMFPSPYGPFLGPPDPSAGAYSTPDNSVSNPQTHPHAPPGQTAQSSMMYAGTTHDMVQYPIHQPSTEFTGTESVPSTIDVKDSVRNQTMLQQIPCATVAVSTDELVLKRNPESSADENV